MSKTNIEFLKDIFKEMSGITPALVTEAEEFLDAVEKELNEANGRVLELHEQVDNLEATINNTELSEKTYLGLDTLNWELENGNLLIQQRVENFLGALKKEFCVGAGTF